MKRVLLKSKGVLWKRRKHSNVTMLKLPPPKNKQQSSDSSKKSTTQTQAVHKPAASTAVVLQNARNESHGGGSVKASFSDLIPAGPNASKDRSIVEAYEDTIAQQTSDAISRIVAAKVANTDQTGKSLEKAQNRPSSSYIKVAGSTDAITGKTSKDRVFRVAEKAVDPLEPAKFKFRAVPKPPGSPPAPILHSPTRKATEEEKAAWDVPASVSNWINSQGYVVSLEKRLAQKAPPEAPTINDKFGKLADALLSAEDVSRKAVAERAKLKLINEERKKEAENEALRIAAAEARNAKNRAAAGSSIHTRRESSSSSESESEEEGDDEARRERDRQRYAMKREAEREMKRQLAGKRTKAMREEDRDISERIALGKPVPKAGSSSLEMEFDQRLFSKGSAGLNSGHGAEDEDNLYTTSLFKQSSDSIYRPSSNVREMKSASELQAKLNELKEHGDKFQGFKGSASGSVGGSRGDGPVQFEAVPKRSRMEEEDDPLQGMAFSAPQRKVASSMDENAKKRSTMSASRFTGGAIESKPSNMEEPTEAELKEEMMIKKLQEKESKSRKITFVKGSDSG